jgi:hypothetical protein
MIAEIVQGLFTCRSVAITVLRHAAYTIRRYDRANVLDWQAAPSIISQDSPRPYSTDFESISDKKGSERTGDWLSSIEFSMDLYFRPTFKTDRRAPSHF